MGVTDVDRWGGMVAFVAVAERLSFVDAAEQLGLSASALSRRIAQLENRLGSRLLVRTTRQVALTEVGALYLERCRNLIDQGDEADAVVRSHSAEPRGLLRVGLPALYGQTRIAPLLPAFLARYPEVRLDLVFDDHYADLVDRRLDVAVRIGGQFEGDFVIRRLAPNPRIICASPDYLVSHGEPASPRDLADHQLLHFAPLSDAGRWRLKRDGRSQDVPVRPKVSSDNAEALRLLALAGHGVTLLADFVIGDDIAAGRLVPLLTAWTAAESHVHIIYPTTRHLPPKTRAFIDYLIETVR